MDTLPRHGPRRPYRPDTLAAAAEEAGVRQALARGTLALAPRATGWVEVWDEDGVLTEAPVLHEGRAVASWDTDALGRWMRPRTAQRTTSVVARVRALLARARR